MQLNNVHTPVIESRQDDDKELKRQERRLTRAIDEIETKLPFLDEEIAALQDELSNPELCR